MVKRTIIKINDEWAQELTERVESSIYLVNKVLLDKVKELRAENKMTVIGLARLSGVRRATIFEWIAGKFMLERWRTLQRIAISLDVKIRITA